MAIRVGPDDSHQEIKGRLHSAEGSDMNLESEYGNIWNKVRREMIYLYPARNGYNEPRYNPDFDQQYLYVG
jgi:hypothetical protein